MGVAFVVQLFFVLWRPADYIKDGPLHLFYKAARISLATTRGPAVIELVLISTAMAVAAFWLRSHIRSQWLVPAYLLLLTLPSALLNLVQLSIRHGSLLAGLGLWEGPNWLTGCIPFSSFLLLAAVDQIKQNGATLLTPSRDLSGAPQEQTAAGVV
jgi:hypothetical protein